ncbi:beta-ketoacyl synthase N-terminal-like domain-containing protein [Microseira sp. BLCC-F43]|jgi:acyl transferase domain-containing protein|uniref:type I polyketide synthase n=1 Tax=Microseira sp. BLCC-F43 TaxID=3153602 RepID=UPI0035B7F2EE
MTEELESIAIVGMAGRFPGAKNIDEFWQNIRDGVESIRFFNDEELLDSGIEPEDLKQPNYVKAGATLEDIDLFDAAFFGFSPREAQMTDPQHRLFLECAWEALENAGYNSETYPDRIGAFAGVGWNSYLFNNLYSNREFIEAISGRQALMGNDKDFLTTRLSYKLNLRGPSINIQTACSTSLVATSFACSSLLSYQCDMALAGGVSIFVPHKTGYLYQEGGILSPDGHCRAFDAKAQGTAIGNGVGIVVLKRLSDAIADRDCIHGVIKSAAINNDGALKVGYTAPSVEGQTRAIAEAIGLAGINPETITYIETHGTATPLGDPVEIAALTEAFSLYTNKKRFCAIGSVKSNIGHLDTAAGVAGLIKTVLALKNKQIPPSLHFQEPNPEIDFDRSPFYVNTKLSEWKSNGTPRRAGVSSFGIGGTNAHVILEESHNFTRNVSLSNAEGRKNHLLVLSAKTNSALETATTNLVDYLKQQKDLNLADVAYTLQVGRRSFSYRRTVVCQDIEDAVKALETQAAKRVFSSFQECCDRSVVFMFPGQGSQYVNMGRELYQTESVFSQQIDRCADILKPHLGLDIRHILYPSEEQIQAAEEQLKQTCFTQPILFAIEYALAQLWMSWGIRPVAAIGHSIGEYVAACIADVFSLEDALALVAIRGQLMQELPNGAMLSVPLSEAEVQPLLNEELSLAANNAPSLCVVSGTINAVEALQIRLKKEGIESRRLQTSGGFHSQIMDSIIEPFIEQLAKIKLKYPQIPFVSNLTGTWITAKEATEPIYWAKHLRQTVRFNEGIACLLQQPGRIFLEVGPGKTLSTFALQHHNGLVLNSMRHPKEIQSDVAFLLNTLGQLWLGGFQIDWSGFYAGESRYRIPLPTYPFERQRYWIDPRKQVGKQEVNSPLPTTQYPLSTSESSVAPSNQIESIIAEAYQRLLGVQQVGIHDSFFDLGGHSLIGIQLISQLRKDFQVDLSLSTLFEAPTVAELAFFIEEMLIEELEQLPEEAEELVSVVYQ